MTRQATLFEVVTVAEEKANGSVLREHADAIRGLGKRVITDVIEIGRRLTEAKAIAGHGSWLSWLEREFGWKERTAQNFMQVHELAKSANFADLSLPVSGLYLLAAPSTPEKARTEIIERAEAGEKLSVAGIKETIEQARTDTKGRRQPATRARPAPARKRRARSSIIVAELSPLSWSKANAESRQRFVGAVGIKSLVEAVEADSIYSILTNAWKRASAEERSRFLQCINSEVRDANVSHVRADDGDAP